jgi:hypothetical protein
MSTADLLQWFSTFVIACALAYLAFRKAPAERQNLNGSASESYAKAAQMKGEENLKLEKMVDLQEKRIRLLETKRYRVTVEFEIGDPTNTGTVKIEPVVPALSETEYKKISRRNALLRERADKKELER